MPAHDEHNCARCAWPGVALGVLVLAAATALGLGPVESGLRDAVTPPPAPDAAAPAAYTAPKAVAAAVPTFDTARAQAEGEAVAFYFAGGSAELPADAATALGGVVMGVAAGKKAVIGSLADALPTQRALAVQGALTALGIGPDKIELRPQPAAAEASGDTPQARRVEVTLE